jgi:hypothetical protein
MLARVANKANTLSEATREHLHIMAQPCGLEARFIDQEELAFEGVGIHCRVGHVFCNCRGLGQILPHGA